MVRGDLSTYEITLHPGASLRTGPACGPSLMVPGSLGSLRPSPNLPHVIVPRLTEISNCQCILLEGGWAYTPQD